MSGTPTGNELHEHQAKQIGAVRFAVLTLSDTRTVETDVSGQWIVQRLQEAGHEISEYQVIPDDAEIIRERLLEKINRELVDVVITTGGTGISARDVAYETISSIVEKRLDGFGELFRMLSFQQIGAAAMMSRAVAGTSGRTAIFALPGSTKAVKLGVEQLILPQAKHIVSELHKH